MRAVFIFVLATFAAASLSAMPYWPENSTGTIYRYQDSSGTTADVTYTASPAEIDWDYQFTGLECSRSETYAVSAGEVRLGNVSQMCAGWIDPDWMTYSPGLPVVWGGMYDGEGFLWSGDGMGVPGNVVVGVTAMSIDIPLGTFEVLRVEHIAVGAVEVKSLGDFYLHVDLGVIKIGDFELYEISGPVGVESRTWASVKALYR